MAESKTRCSVVERQSKVLKSSLHYSECEAVLFCLECRHLLLKTHGASDAKAVYSTIRQISTMLETDVVGKVVQEFSGEVNDRTRNLSKL